MGENVGQSTHERDVCILATERFHRSGLIQRNEPLHRYAESTAQVGGDGFDVAEQLLWVLLWDEGEHQRIALGGR